MRGYAAEFMLKFGSHCSEWEGGASEKPKSLFPVAPSLQGASASALAKELSSLCVHTWGWLGWG